MEKKYFDDAIRIFNSIVNIVEKTKHSNDNWKSFFEEIEKIIHIILQDYISIDSALFWNVKYALLYLFSNDFDETLTSIDHEINNKMININDIKEFETKKIINCLYLELIMAGVFADLDSKKEEKC